MVRVYRANECEGYMAVVDVFNCKAEKVSQVELQEDIYNVEVKSCVLHEVVTMQLANRRAGTASVKTRSDVQGSTRKLFKQKGTGRARRGDIKSPLLRGGGSVFGPHPRSYAYKVPKKVRRLALKMALSAKAQSEFLLVLDKFDLEQIRTQQVVQILNALKVEKALIVADTGDEILRLSCRNLPHVKVLKPEGLNVYDILKYKHLLLVEPSIKAIEGRLLK
jgi:large subunit ribosomal protein L4